MGDGSSDVHVMLHVHRIGGLTIAVSENRYLAPIARRTILSDDGRPTTLRRVQAAAAALWVGLRCAHRDVDVKGGT